MNKPLFWTVTGRDFGRSIAWARKQPNELSEHIRAAIANLPPKIPPPTVTKVQTEFGDMTFVTVPPEALPPGCLGYMAIPHEKILSLKDAEPA